MAWPLAEEFFCGFPNHSENLKPVSGIFQSAFKVEQTLTLSVDRIKGKSSNWP